MCIHVHFQKITKTSKETTSAHSHMYARVYANANMYVDVFV